MSIVVNSIKIELFSMIAKTYGHFLLERDEYGRTTNNYGTLVSYVR
ncbi:hypothetical protein SAU060112_30088 [Staphylococcus aureus]|nr:hypothetical protein SAU060112_30088 [Staphylococcus aureus]